MEVEGPLCVLRGQKERAFEIMILKNGAILAPNSRAAMGLVGPQ